MRGLIKAGISAVVLSLGLAAPVAAGPFEDGTAAYNGGDYATAMRLWRPLADDGNAKAQDWLGVTYATGRGVPKDDAIAVSWFQKAADRVSPRLNTLSGSGTKTAKVCRRTMRLR